ncbi:hypothetical protein V2J09_001723 [Rumex salicifolius]
MVTHANFHEFLSQSWSHDCPIIQALTRLRRKLVKWNKTNIAFFHSSTIIRRKRNHILTLKGETVVWIEEADLLENHARDYFNRLYSLNVEELNPINLPHDLFLTLAEDRWEVLATPISDEEIQKAVRGMGAYKARGPDGLQPCFYQSFWNVVGPSMSSVVRQFFDSSVMPMGLNDTLITLIAKVSCQRESRNSDPLVSAMCCSKSSPKFL